jgi:hypothetical protein
MKIQKKAEKSGKKWKNVKKSVFSRSAGIPVLHPVSLKKGSRSRGTYI